MDRKTTSSGPGRRLTAAALVCGCLGLAGCSVGDFLVNILNAVGLAQDTQVQISGASYFTLDRKDSRDGSTASPGFVCVVHDPGCGITGNNGKDRFFLSRPLPPLSRVVGVKFQAIAPDGLPANDAGGIGGWGSYGASLDAGPTDGSAPIVVSWKNACQGVYGTKPVAYLMSFVIATKKGIDMIDPGVATTAAPPACGPAPGGGGPPPVPPMSGWEGSLRLCLPMRNPASLHLEAKLTLAATGATSGTKTLSEDIPITLIDQGAGVWQATFKTKQTYEPGTWQITKAQVAGDTGLLTGTPVTVQLPGGAGTPVLDFTGGRCTTG